MEKTRAMRLIELEYGGMPIQAILAELFDELKTQQAVARRLGISHPTLVAWLDLFGAKRQQIREYSLRITFPESESLETAAS